MKIAMFGAPGVGKGTYSKAIKGELGIPHISTGDIFRDNIKRETELGKQVKDLLEKGEFVPDGVTIEIVKGRLQEDDCKEGYLLDGFPRTLPQAQALDEFEKLNVVLNFIASEDTIIQRLSGRRICKKCGAIFHMTNKQPKEEGICDNCGDTLFHRPDDQPEAIKDRLRIYQEQTQPLIEYYKEKGILKEVDASPDFSTHGEEILNSMRSILNEMKGE
jgi:adenylate kinase